MAEPLYRDYTRNTREPLKRLAHGTRLQKAAEMVPVDRTTRVLDYGCGDGGLLEILLEQADGANLFGFDPHLLGEMEPAVRSRVTTFSETDALLRDHAASFDVVFCIEVCEHLSGPAREEVMANVEALMKPDGCAVFGVPIETGLSGFAKNVYRTFKGNRQGAGLAHALRALLHVPIPRAFDEHGWTDSHLGFDHRGLEREIGGRGFAVQHRRHLPWGVLGTVLNNEIYFICSRRG